MMMTPKMSTRFLEGDTESVPMPMPPLERDIQSVPMPMAPPEDEFQNDADPRILLAKAFTDGTQGTLDVNIHGTVNIYIDATESVFLVPPEHFETPNSIPNFV